MAYNPYSDIQKVYNAKVAWNNATTEAERNKQNRIATAARRNLEAYGYGDVANQISASGADATAARKIMEQYAPTAPASTNDTDAELMTKHNNEIRNKTNQLWGIQADDRTAMAGKYDKLENTAYSNPFETDEAKAILSKYDLKAMQGRDNAVASGGASNGGNIDSYAAANAMRQQTAVLNQGQMAVLDAHNNKINNVKGILESLGVYQQNQDKGMQNTITLQQDESQRLFENGETAKNNDVARKSEIASVTGYAPDEWVVSNNPYMNDDGTIKDEYKNIDFSAVMAKAKETGNTAAYNAAATARYYKIMSDYGAYGQYDDGNYIVPGQQETEARRQFNEQAAISRESLKSEKEINDANNQNKLDQINTQTQGEKELLEFKNKLGANLTAEELKTQTDKVISQWLYSPYKDTSGSTEVWKEGYETKSPQYIAAEKISDPDILESIKDNLTAAGWDADKKIKEYRKNIAIEIAKLEGLNYNDSDVLKSIYERSGYQWVWDSKDS